MTDVRGLEVFAVDLAQARRANAFASSLDAVGDLGVLEAYAIQASATDLMDDEIRGWKIGRLPATTRGPGLTQRFIGPVFSRTIRHQRGPVCRVGVSGDRANAIEAEFLVKLQAPLECPPVQQGDDFWMTRIAAIHVGVELAGNDLSPRALANPNVQIAAFGNNRGLIVGEPIRREQWSVPMSVSTIIDGRTAGVSEAISPWATALESLTDAWVEAAALGIAFQSELWIATGALTGIHAIAPKQDAIVEFDGYESLQMVTFDTRTWQNAS